MEMKIVDICHVSPSKDSPSPLLLPLLHSDMIWLPSHLTKALFFYHVRFSESLFHNYIIPSLKNSLSLTLKHFLPLAGNLVIPLSSGMPVSHYTEGDSVALTIALSGANFQRLTGDHNFLDAAELDDFVPQLPPPTYLTHQIVELPAAAIQITLFPNHGICIGLNIHHAVADGATVDGFVRAWASINKFKDDAHLAAIDNGFRPHYDRSVVYDADKLVAKYWPESLPVNSLPTYVEARFVLTEAIGKILMKFLLNQEKPAAATRDVDSSTFAVASAYVWCCLAMSAAAAGETVADDEPEFLAMALDCRARQNSPSPDTYFSNYSTPVLVESTHGTLKRKGCFVAAAEAITEAISKVINSDWGSLEDSRNLSTGNRKLVVCGSPTFDAYGVDYGWGRPKMFTSLAKKTSSHLQIERWWS